jgi:hypothetical protein
MVMPDTTPHKPCWWSISETALLAMLHRVEAGESAEMVYISEYATATITDVSGDDDAESEG